MSQNTRLYSQLYYEEGHWLPLDKFPANEADPWLHWLEDSSSLTARLTKLADFRIEVLAQYWHKPLPSELACLQQDSDDLRVWIRESVLICDDQPCVYGRSVIPCSTMEQYQHQFENLQTNSMANVLFNDPGMVRSDFEFAQLQLKQQVVSGDQFVESKQSGDETVWSRRSLFSLADHPLLVTEIFLPSILRYDWKNTLAECKQA